MQIPDFSDAKLLVVGDVMLDRYWSGKTGRISPEAPVPVVNVNDIEDRPGGAANVAINAAALGADVTLMGLIGDDDAGKKLAEQLDVHGIKTEFSIVSGFDTITKLRVMSRHQQLLRVDFEKSFEQVDKSQQLTQFEALLENIDVVVLSDYAKGSLSNISALIQAANRANKKIVVDPKGNDFSKYSGATIITPNMSEFETAFGYSDSEQGLLELASSARQSHGIDNILLTRSEQGMTLFADGLSQHNPALAKEVYDVTGAGDTVVSTLASALAVGADMSLACQLANHAAGVVVGKLGTSAVTPTELAIAINSHKAIDGGVMSLAQLSLSLEQAKKRGEKIVFTNGCFDILHAGHVSYLQEAADLGDRLVVAVNSDASVERLKGKGRPINSVKRRMAVLAGLQSVDWVVEFEEDTPFNVISTLLPDVLVKGGDYQLQDIVGGDVVRENGGDVFSLSFADGISTTAIITQILGNPQ